MLLSLCCARPSSKRPVRIKNPGRRRTSTKHNKTETKVKVTDWKTIIEKKRVKLAKISVTITGAQFVNCFSPCDGVHRFQS